MEPTRKILIVLAVLAGLAGGCNKPRSIFSDPGAGVPAKTPIAIDHPKSTPSHLATPTTKTYELSMLENHFVRGQLTIYCQSREGGGISQDCGKVTISNARAARCFDIQALKIKETSKEFGESQDRFASPHVNVDEVAVACLKREAAEFKKNNEAEKLPRIKTRFDQIEERIRALEAKIKRLEATADK